MSVLETVQETLFQQFLAGSDPSRRLAESQEPSSRVEDLPWWKYQRALALWYCEWLDTYYDSGERRFFWRDELTQGFEAADLAELKDLAQRMRLELPEHDAVEIPEVSDVEKTERVAVEDGDDGDWHVAALAAAVEDEEELLWKEDGQGNLTHWAAEVGRLFLWQEHSGVLYEYLPASDTRSGRWLARWALTPLLVVSVSAAPAELRPVERQITLGSEAEEPCWKFSSLQPVHARVFRKGKRWWVEALDDASPSLLNGQRLQLGKPMALLSSALLRLNDVELQLDLPETPGAAPATGLAATTATATAPVLQRDFVPREEESPSPQPTGTAHAHALNRALRRLVCGSNTQSKALEWPDVLAREQRYEDRAEKRRRLHPVEWPQPATPAATAPQPALAAPLEARMEPQISRRFTEQPG